MLSGHDFCFSECRLDSPTWAFSTRLEYQAIGYSWTYKSQLSSLERKTLYSLGSNLKSQGRALIGLVLINDLFQIQVPLKPNGGGWGEGYNPKRSGHVVSRRKQWLDIQTMMSFTVPEFPTTLVPGPPHLPATKSSP